MPIAHMINKPTLLLNEKKTRTNIKHMAAKAHKNGVRLRPHFKTHQSGTIGEWFRQENVKAITVSSMDMAVYFAQHGWQDILIAFPVNLRQMEIINELAHQIKLHLLVESVAAVEYLGRQLTADTQIWLKIDVGYRRTGLAWDDVVGITAVAQAINQFPQLHLTGSLTHAGHTYGVRGQEAVTAVYQQSVQRLKTVQAALQQIGWQTLISVGDTPGASLVDDYGPIDEMRPGNFVFYDLMQLIIGACNEAEIAVALACPVVAKHPEREQIIIYGGAVHLSKEVLREEDGRLSYGRVAQLTNDGWTATLPGVYVTSMSQEHGIIQANAALLDQTQIGDLLVVLPAHSCLTANLLGRYLTLDGQWIEMMNRN